MASSRHMVRTLRQTSETDYSERGVNGPTRSGQTTFTRDRPSSNQSRLTYVFSHLVLAVLFCTCIAESVYSGEGGLRVGMETGMDFEKKKTSPQVG